jgi:hypothetical protein
VTAVLAWARLDARRRWASLLTLVLLVALSGAVILSTLAGARRTDTVLERLDAKTTPADVLVLPNKAGFDWSKVRALPSVRALGTFVLTEASPTAVDGNGHRLDLDSALSFPAGDLDQNRIVDGAALISGRLPDPNNPNEIIVSPGFVHRYGASITLTFPSQAQAATLVHGQSLPPDEKLTGRVAHLHVVGVGVNTFGLGAGDGPVFQPTYAFFTHYIKGLIPYFKNARVILKGGIATLPEFQKELGAATGNPNLQVDNWHEFTRVIQRAASFTAVGWAVFALVALIATIVLVGQAFVRYAGGATADLETLSALGLDRRQVRQAAAVGPAFACVLGVVAAIAVAAVGSQLFPTGISRGFEPNPGISVNVAILGGGGLVLMAIGLVGALLAGRAASRDRSEPHERPSVVAAAARRAGIGVSALLGTRFALEAGRGKTRVPVKPALIGAVAGVLGVVGALTFRTGLNSTVDDLARFGQTWGDAAFVSEGGPPPSFQPKLRQFAKDPDLAMLNDLRVASLPINGRTTTATSITPLVGYPKIVVLAGHPPTSASEISLGPQTAHDLHAHVGSAVTVGRLRMTVSGITFVPQNPHNDYTDGVWLTTAGFRAVQPDESQDKFHEFIFTFKRGVTQRAGLAGLPKGLALGGAGPTKDFFTPEQQVELRSLRLQPLWLGGFLIVLALGAVGHGLATAVRRRRHDVAVLRACGLTRWQTRGIVVTQATVLALVGLVVGIPLGIASGRTAWRILAQSTPVYYVAPIALIGLLIAIPVTIAVANMLAALPARRAVRLPINTILRAE